MPFLKKLAVIFLNARSRPVIPYYTQVSDVSQRWINAVLADRVEPHKALQNAEEEIAALLERYTTK